jgi:dTDP-4-dehydrorhamnose reductase
MWIGQDSRIYIAGCGGMLGKAVYSLFSSVAAVKATDIDVNEAWLAYADVRDLAAMTRSIEEFEPHAIINLAALTDLEFCEREQENAWLTNALGAENLGMLAARMGVPYVYISTAGIFDGRKETYHDFDQPNPLSCYGQSKYYGERYVLEHVPDHFVVRAGWMMGGGPSKDKKFINKLYRQIKSGSRELHVVDDKRGTPTYTEDFARGLLRLLESRCYGLYNQVCEGNGSRYDVAEEFVRALGLQGQVKVERVDSSHFKQEYFAPRPASEQLINLKLRQRGLNVMRDWRVCLHEYSRVFRVDLDSSEGGAARSRAAAR